MNGTVSAKEIKSIINNCPKQKPPGPNEFTDNFYQKFHRNFDSFYIESTDQSVIYILKILNLLINE